MPSERKATRQAGLERLLSNVNPLPQARQLARDVFSSIRRGRQLVVSWAEPQSRRHAGLLPLVAHAAAIQGRLLIVVPDLLDRTLLLALVRDWSTALDTPLPVHLVADIKQDLPTGPGVLILGTEVFVPYLHALELKLEAGARLAPDLVYIEDAQVLPDVARRYTTRRVDEAALLEALKPLTKVVPTSLRSNAEKSARRFFRDLNILRDSGRFSLRLTDAQPVENFELLDRLEAAAVALESGSTPEGIRRATRLRWLQRAIDEAMDLAGPGRVHYLQQGKEGSVTLCTTRTDLTKLLEPVWQGAFTVLAGPAIGTASAFFYLRDQLGFSASSRRLAGLDPERPLLLVTPDHLPDSGEYHWGTVALREAIAGMEELPGPTLALCGAATLLDGIASSRYSMRRTLERWDDQVHPGMGPDTDMRHDLLVSSDPLPMDTWPTNVWRSLLVDRLPFPRPEDPVLDALKVCEPAWFSRYALPRAALAFRSHLARFACSSPLPGLVLVLDSRLSGRGYARAFLEGFPRVQQSRMLEGLSTVNASHLEVRP